MRIEDIKRSDIEKMDIEELQTLRNRFLQMNEKWWGSPFWPDCSEAVCLEKYRMVSDEFKKREIFFLRKDIDRALVGMIFEEISKSKPVDISKPYPNQHACQLRDPGDFEDGSIRTMEREHDEKEYNVLMGKLEGQTTMTEQAYRYDKDTWDVDDARAHCKDHDGKFEAAKETEKTEGKEQFSKYVKFVGVQKDEKNPERFVMGIVYEPDTKDSEGDWATAEEIRQAAYTFMESGQIYKINHDKGASIHVLESFIAPVDYEVEGEQVKKGSWLLGSRVLDDDIWEKIEKGELTGYSMAGEALRVEEPV